MERVCHQEIQASLGAFGQLKARSITLSGGIDAAVSGLAHSRDELRTLYRKEDVLNLLCKPEGATAPVTAADLRKELKAAVAEWLENQEKSETSSERHNLQNL